MNPSENNSFQHPTIGPSYEVQKAAELLFKGWLPKRWLLREENPDVHIDFCVEVVNDGEPSGSLFRVQVKGRSIYKRKAKKLAEPLETKHLRYFLQCKEPVFIFLIDPTAKQGHWIFIQRYLKESVRSDALRVQKELTIPFDAQCSLENQPLFEKELRDAWSYMQNLYPGSPAAALLAEKKRFEQLDPNVSLSVKYQVSFHQPKLEFLNKCGPEELKAFFEKGQSFQAKASDIHFGDTVVFPEAGDAKVTINYGVRFKGCLQFHFGSQTEPLCIQIDGEWVLAPKRNSFSGQLGESPLKVACVNEKGEDGKWKPWEMTFRLNWGAWEGQALLALAYFVELDAFLRENKFFLRSYVRGHPEWPAENFVLDNPEKKQAIEAMDWLQKCKRVARRIGSNPPFPAANAINKIESDDVRLLVKLIEEGVHKQSMVGQTLELSVGNPYTGPEIGKKELTANHQEPFRKINFFGLEIPFGPLIHTWTDLELVSTCPLDDDRTGMMFKGGVNSTWKIEYKHPPQDG